MGGVDVSIRGLGADPLVFGRVGALGTVVQNSSDGVVSFRNLSRPWPPPSRGSGDVSAFIQTRPYPGLDTQQAASLLSAVSLDGVIRTTQAWVDRSQLRIAFQLKDSYGSPRVDAASVRRVVLVVTSGLRSRTTTCDSTRISRSSDHYLGSCSVPSLAEDWFGAGGSEATVSVQMTPSGGEASEVTVSLGSVQLVAKPTWYDSRLRSTGQIVDVAPPGHSDGPGLFVTLPTSPLYAATETFSAYMYVNTAGFSINSWRVKLYFNTDVLRFVSADVGSLFKPPVASSSVDGASFSSAGLVCGTTCDSQDLAAANGDVVFLLRINLAVRSGVAPQTYMDAALSLYPYAFEVLNYGGGYVHDKVSGLVYDARDSAHSLGQIVVRSPSTTGIFAYLPPRQTPQAVLPNLAPLRGVPSAYQTLVVAVTSYDLADRGSRVVSEVGGSGRVACQFDTLPAGVLSSYADCNLQMGLAETVGADDLEMRVTYSDGSTFSRDMELSVYAFAEVSLQASDSTLNRFRTLAGTPAASCSTQFYPYQRSRIIATADGFDVTPTVTFVSSNPSVAAASAHQWNLIEGRSVGSATITLFAGAPLSQGVTIEVSDDAVSVAALHARLVTTVVWERQPESAYTYPLDVPAAVLLSQRMRMEGDSGLIFTSVTWEDGLSEEVGYAPAPGVRELQVSSSTSNVELTAPQSRGNSENFWKVAVAAGAQSECGAPIVVNWTACGDVIGSGALPLHLLMPQAVEAALDASTRRLAPVGDDATLPGVGIPSSSQLQVTVTFEAQDGSFTTADLTSDDRVSYSTSDSTCAIADNVLNSVKVLADARCSEVDVIATVSMPGATLEATVSMSIVRVARATLAFTGYPKTAVNSLVQVQALGLIPCQDGVYTSASAQLRVSLDDESASSYDITSSTSTSFDSNATSVVRVNSGSTRLAGIGSGVALVTGTFGSTSASLTLPVRDEVLDAVSSVDWTIPQIEDGTFLDVINSTRSTTVDLRFESGLVWVNLKGAAFDGWAGPAC